jgi:chemotaxis protein methyltransferase CheR
VRETEELINSFTVNETYFYREEHQFRCLGADILPEIVAKRGPGDLVRLWSVPCSTGEEPYSLAIWLLENWRLVDAYNIEIVGSDIDTDALGAAAHGAFGERSLARLPGDVRARYFEPVRDGQWRIVRDLRESVRYTPVNLIDGAAMAAQGMFDVIFCRNVLIYFDEASRRRAAEHLFAALRPGGFICLGHTESMSRIDDRFAVRRFSEAIVYQRPAV